MTDIGKFTEPKNKMVPREPRPSKLEVQKNGSLTLITEIPYLKQNVFF